MYNLIYFLLAHDDVTRHHLIENILILNWNPSIRTSYTTLMIESKNKFHLPEKNKQNNKLKYNTIKTCHHNTLRLLVYDLLVCSILNYNENKSLFSFLFDITSRESLV